jgi:uncharacterized protein YndB with AHSA1/START domain
MSEYDWNKFRARIDVKADTGDIYSAWTTRAGLERWFLRVAEFTGSDGELRGGDEKIQKGDRYQWLWHGYDDTVAEQGVIEEANGCDLLRFTFAGSCLVSVRLTIEGGVTMVELLQENIPLDETSRAKYHVGCLTGWTFYLANLKSILQGGIDLRNKNQDIRGVINA